jgi:glycosyltransferase involved in cell wall biosynthesis
MSLRIAHVVSTFPPYLGGAGTVCFELASGLAKRGHQVEVFTSTAPGPTPSTPATVHRLRPALAIGNAPLLPPLARLADFDVVHLHYPFIFGTELLLTGRARRLPLVVSYHNRLIGQGLRGPLFRGYEETWGRALARRADRLCVLSGAHARTVPYLATALRRAPERVVEIPNGVDVDAFSPGPSDVRDRLAIPAEAPLVAFVATLDRAHYLKRPDLALEAVARLGDLGAHLLVVGGGEDEPALLAQAARLGIAERVHFAGAVGHDGLPDHLRAADVLVSSSDLESFGLVLIEAMACGLPVVSTDLPGTRVVVRDGETGFLVRRGDPAAIAGGIRRALGGDRAALGAAGRADCERRFAWPRVVEAVERVYREVVPLP